jgi:hypothetical protein
MRDFVAQKPAITLPQVVHFAFTIDPAPLAPHNRAAAQPEITS